MDKKEQSFRERLGNIIFEHDTKLARGFDVVLLWAIFGSILVAMLESVSQYAEAYGPVLRNLEWFFTVVFTIEYVLRVYSARERAKYIRSFFGLVDLLAILPTYLSLLLPGSQYLIVLRSVRLLRIFRVLKLLRYVGEAESLLLALQASRRKITIFIYTVITIVSIVGTAMYLIEGPERGFTSIPISMYWAIVTLTTVGYGDIAPQTALGQLLASAVMILGYGIIAVPTGIVTVELSRVGELASRKCASCSKNVGVKEAKFCQFCGTAIES